MSTLGIRCQQRFNKLKQFHNIFKCFRKIKNTREKSCLLIPSWSRPVSPRLGPTWRRIPCILTCRSTNRPVTVRPATAHPAPDRSPDNLTADRPQTARPTFGFSKTSRHHLLLDSEANNLKIRQQMGYDIATN